MEKTELSQRWNPLLDLLLLLDRMNRLFEDATQRRAREEADSGNEIETAEWYPAADVYEDEANYVIEVDLPGIDRSALEINIDDNRLAIKGERRRLSNNKTSRPNTATVFLKCASPNSRRKRRNVLKSRCHKPDHFLGRYL